MEIPKKVASGLMELITLNDAILDFFMLLDDEEISKELYDECLKAIGIISIGTMYGEDGIKIIKEIIERLK